MVISIPAAWKLENAVHFVNSGSREIKGVVEISPRLVRDSSDRRSERVHCVSCYNQL
jgi:hypothetical protein